MERAHSKSGLFLIEMIIIILFLAIASAFCVQVFVGSHGKSVEAEELSMAETIAGGAADVIRGSDFEKTVDLTVCYPKGIPTENGMCLYYDENWELCDRADCAYMMEIAISEENRQRTGKIRVLDAAQKEIYSLKAQVHIRYKAEPGNGGDET